MAKAKMKKATPCQPKPPTAASAPGSAKTFRKQRAAARGRSKR